MGLIYNADMIITSDSQIYWFIFLFSAVVLFILLSRLLNKYDKWWKIQDSEKLKKEHRQPPVTFFWLLLITYPIAVFGIWNIPYDLIRVFILWIVTIIGVIYWFLIKNPK